MSVEEKSSVTVSFGEQSKGYTADVKIKAVQGATTEQLEELANKAYLVAKATFEEASAYTAIKSTTKNPR